MSVPLTDDPGTMLQRGEAGQLALVVHEGSDSAVVAIYNTHRRAEAAVRELARSGFDMRRLSIVGRHYQTEQDVVGFYSTGERMQAWGRRGAFWGGLWGLLFGSAMFVVPGVGPLFGAGPLVGWVVGALEGAVVVGGMSVIGAAFYGIGIPADSVIEYEARLKAGQYVLLARGPQRDRDQMRAALGSTPHATLADHTCHPSS